jgi:hypothetical protein
VNGVVRLAHTEPRERQQPSAPFPGNSKPDPARGDKMVRVSYGEWVKAAVLDASYLDKGRTNIGEFERLAAGIEARCAELWIPEVVVLELLGQQRAS